MQMINMSVETCKLVYFTLLLTVHSAAAIFRYFPHKEQAYSIEDVQDVYNANKSNGFFMYSQKLDHFDHVNTQRWDQLYYIDDQFYKPGGPVFLFVGGEFSIGKPNYNYQFQWTKWGNQSNALLVTLEHRYYGISQPFKNMTTDNLRYLTVDQALADAAMFQHYIMTKKHLAPNTKWIAFGASYAGVLVAWLRMTYPHLIHGSVSSSAPILLTPEFTDYMKVVTEDLNKHCGGQIASDVQITFETMEIFIKAPNATATVLKDFLFCSDFNISNEMDRYMFLAQAVYPFMVAAQYGSMPAVCAKLKNESIKSMTKKIALLMQHDIFVKSDEPNCVETYHSHIKRFRNTNVSHEGFQTTILRLWSYQTCTELGYFQTTGSAWQLFGRGLKLKYDLRKCNDVFDLNITEHSLSEAINRMNMLKGGRRPLLSNVIFVNGLEDPWHTLSVLKPYSKKVETVIIKNGSHCQDILPDLPTDSDELKKARESIYEFIKKLLQH